MDLSEVVKSEFGAAVPTQRVELRMDGDLPSIRFFWKPVIGLYCLEPLEVEILAGQGFTPEPSKGSDKPSIHLQHVEERVITLCNFRRYGWSWTDDPRGEAGYSYGVTYANDQVPITYLASTPEEVVRDALVQTWAELCWKERWSEFGRLFNTHAVHAALVHLYRDAIANLSVHASPWTRRRMYGGRSEFPIVFVTKDGTERRFEPTVPPGADPGRMAAWDYLLPGYLAAVLSPEEASVAEALLGRSRGTL